MINIKSPISLTGSKHYQSPWIISHFPKHHDVYVEVFGGGAHVLVQKPTAKVEIYNDINEDLVNFLMIARSWPDKLYRACDSLPVSRSLFEKWKWEDVPEDNFERAVKWFYVMRQSFGGMQRYKTGWKASKERNVAQSYHTACGLITSISERFRNVAIENDDFRNIIERYDSPGTLFYLDPPYIDLEYYYSGEFDKNDHKDLAKILSNIKGKAVISYYENELTDKLYDGWNKDSRGFAKYAGRKRNMGKEVLYMNFEKKMSLF